MAQLTVKIAGVDRSATVLLPSLEIALEQPVSTCRFVIRDETSSISISQLDTVLVELTSGGADRFQGEVTGARYYREESMLPGQRLIDIEAASWAWVASARSQPLTVSYENQTDQDIVIDLVAQAGLDGEITANSTNVDNTTSGLTIFVGPRSSLREALDQVAAIVGARWYIDEQKVLHWNSETGAASAPKDVNIDTAAAGTIGHRDSGGSVWGLEYGLDATELANDVLVIGGQNEVGAIYRATATDATSQSAYGVFPRVYEDSAFITQELVDELAASVIADFKDPRPYFRFATSYDADWQPNQAVDITAADFGLSAETLLVRRVTITLRGKDQTVYELEGGAELNNMSRLVARQQALANQAQSAQTLVGLYCGNAANARANMGDASDFQFLTNKLISFWVFPYAVPSGTNGTLVAKGNGTTSGWAMEWLTSGKLRWRRGLLGGGSVDSEVITTATDLLPLNQWTHVYFHHVWSTGPHRFWINGEIVAAYDTDTSGSGAAESDTGQDLIIGENCDAVFAQVVINDALGSTWDRDALASSPFVDVVPGIFDSAELEGYYKLDDGADDVEPSTGDLADSSGSGNTGDGENTPSFRALTWSPR